MRKEARSSLLPICGAAVTGRNCLLRPHALSAGDLASHNGSAVRQPSSTGRTRATSGSISARRHSPGSDHPLASTWNRVGTFIYKRGDEFYNFEGLRAFKQKFEPVWTPQYLACPRGLALPQVLIEVTSLISGSPMGIFKR